MSAVALYRAHTLKVEEFKAAVINEIVVVEQAETLKEIEIQRVENTKVVTIYKDRVQTNEVVIKEIEKLPLKTADDINKKYQEIMKCFESC